MTQSTTTSATTLQVTDLHKEYPTPAEPLVVLRGISLQLNAGQTLAILGPSGSGKSTLAFGTLDRPTSGTVRLGDVDPFALAGNALAHFRAQHIGFIFQDHHLLPQCTALENVLIARLAAGRVAVEHTARATELLRQVGLSQRLSHFPSELYGGERQRVAIARALINGPSLLLCDEPTGNLDAQSSHAVGDLLTTVAAQTNAILIAVTHSQPLADRFQQRFRLNNGHLSTTN